MKFLSWTWCTCVKEFLRDVNKNACQRLKGLSNSMAAVCRLKKKKRSFVVMLSLNPKQLYPNPRHIWAG